MCGTPVLNCFMGVIRRYRCPRLSSGAAKPRELQISTVAWNFLRVTSAVLTWCNRAIGTIRCDSCFALALLRFSRYAAPPPLQRTLFIGTSHLNVPQGLSKCSGVHGVQISRYPTAFHLPSALDIRCQTLLRLRTTAEL